VFEDCHESQRDSREEHASIVLGQQRISAEDTFETGTLFDNAIEVEQ
jgi:hypothetical protein